MKTKISVICENNVAIPFPVIGEHGLSFLIERDDTTLFDTGQGLGIVNNMKVLGKNIGGLKRIILSHGHYDHTGGLMAVLQYAVVKTPVFVHPAAFNDKRAVIPTGAKPIEMPIGMRNTREEYENAGAHFEIIRGFNKITENISAISDINRPEGWKTWDTRLKEKFENETTDDPFLDDLSLILETDSGPVVLLGCAHAGIIEILHDISEKTGYKEFHAVIGGTHLENAPEEYIARSIETIRQYRVKKIGVSHCTGFRVACRFAAEFKEEFVGANVGSMFEF